MKAIGMEPDFGPGDLDVIVTSNYGSREFHDWFHRRVKGDPLCVSSYGMEDPGDVASRRTPFGLGDTDVSVENLHVIKKLLSGGGEGGRST